jgi:hypothetical protein
MLRSKELQKIAQKSDAILDETNGTQQAQVITALCEGISTAIPHRVDLGESVVSDMQLDTWISTYAQTAGGKEVIQHIIRTPIVDTDILKKRMTVATQIDASIRHKLRELRTYEPTVLWLLSLPLNIQEAPPLHLLFPTWPIVRYLNKVSPVLSAYHVFRGYISPAQSILYPVSAVFGPYFYINRYLKLQISIVQYIVILQYALSIMLRPSGSLKQNVIKYVSVLIYVALFVYGIVQSFDMASMVRRMHADLTNKMKRIHRFVQLSREVIAMLSSTHIEHAYPWFSPASAQIRVENTSMSTFHRIATSATCREQLKAILLSIYTIDAISTVRTVVRRPGWSRCSYIEQGGDTKLWGMGHPLLAAKKQVRNPICLSKNIIITGPNAAGKTTYMKAICANMILAQTIGYVCAVKNVICPIHAISTSIRVHDTVGSESLFEAEVRRCGAMVAEAKRLSDAGKRALYFLDEPMNSTPPIEGAATAMSVASYMGTLPGIRVFLTTHYHDVTRLEDMYAAAWKNVSMEAIGTAEGAFIFPYRIRPGPSFQCIALEILRDHEIPESIIQSAIEMKNKICEMVVDRYAP